MFGDHFLVRLHAEFRAHRAIRPNHAHHFRARLVAKTKVKLRPVDRLFLNQQARANLDLSADTERIDALIAHSLLRVRPNHLPVIILRTMIHALHRLASRIKTEQIEASVAAQVRDIKNPAGCLRVLQKRKFRCRIPKPNQWRCSRLSSRRRDRTENQVKRAVIVEVGDFQPHLARQLGCGIRNLHERRDLPSALFVERNAGDGAIRLDGKQIQNAVVVRIGNAKRFHRRQDSPASATSRNWPCRSL